MRTSVILSIAAALAAVAVASSDEASARSRGDGGGDRGPKAVNIRDHRAPKVVNIRDHRAPKAVNVRDHRTPKTVSVRPERAGFVWVKGKGQPGHWARPRAEVKSTPVVRDHRKPATPVVRDHRTSAPVVRDHRRGATAGGGVTVASGRARQKSAKTYSFRPFGVPPLVTIRR